jgi:hypothetical protein
MKPHDEATGTTRALRRHVFTAHDIGQLDQAIVANSHDSRHLLNQPIAEIHQQNQPVRCFKPVS